MTLASNVKTYRQAKGWTQEDLARKAMTCTGTISMIERGSVPHRHTLNRIARALGVKVKQLEVERQSEYPAKTAAA